MFEKEFNEMIVETFHFILKEEMRFIQSLTGIDLSSREIHLMENVGKNNGRVTVSDAADALQITLASVTVMTNKLEALGYLVKKKDDGDARIVRLSLSGSGMEIDQKHTNFHRTMVKKIMDGLTDFEKETLGGAIKKLNGFFKNDFA